MAAQITGIALRPFLLRPCPRAIRMCRFHTYFARSVNRVGRPFGTERAGRTIRGGGQGEERIAVWGGRNGLKSRGLANGFQRSVGYRKWRLKRSWSKQGWRQRIAVQRNEGADQSGSLGLSFLSASPQVAALGGGCRLSRPVDENVMPEQVSVVNTLK